MLPFLMLLLRRFPIGESPLAPPWPRRVGGIIALVALSGLVTLLIINLVSADSPWPTPPPAPLVTRPKFEGNITPVDVPPVAGAVSSVIQPILQDFLPAIPPLNRVTFHSPDSLKVTIEAGSLDRTIQLIYVPVPLDQAVRPDRLQRLLRVFDLKPYDHRGREFQPELRRPWIMEVPVSKLPGPTGDPSRLLFARFEGGRWVPLVTSYFRDDNVLVARILETGRFAILAEIPPT